MIRKPIFMPYSFQRDLIQLVCMGLNGKSDDPSWPSLWIQGAWSLPWTQGQLWSARLRLGSLGYPHSSPHPVVTCSDCSWRSTVLCSHVKICQDSKWLKGKQPLFLSWSSCTESENSPGYTWLHAQDPFILPCFCSLCHPKPLAKNARIPFPLAPGSTRDSRPLRRGWSFASNGCSLEAAIPETWEPFSCSQPAHRRWSGMGTCGNGGAKGWPCKFKQINIENYLI